MQPGPATRAIAGPAGCPSHSRADDAIRGHCRHRAARRCAGRRPADSGRAHPATVGTAATARGADGGRNGHLSACPRRAEASTRGAGIALTGARHRHTSATRWCYAKRRTIAGLWQASVEQARLAAVNLLGGEARYLPASLPLALKVSGIDLLAADALAPPEDGGQPISFEHRAARTYWKLVVQAGMARGTVVIGDPDLAGLLAQLVARRSDLRQALARLERGDWSAVATLMRDHEGMSA